MKNKGIVITVITIFLIVSIFILMNYSRYYIKEGVLYSQSQLSENNQVNEESNNGLTTRKEAIKLANKVIRHGMNINILKPRVDMYVNLYKDTDDTYKWNISWYDNKSTETYVINIDSNSGKVLYTYINRTTNENVYYDLNKDELLYIIKPLTDVLDINLDYYNMKVTRAIDDNNGVLPYKYCEFVNKNNPNDVFTVKIDCSNQSIEEYEVKTLEVLNEDISSRR